jgi:hypothetical protein
MERCRETAFCLTLWHAILTVIVALLAIVLHDLDRPAALLVAANVALLFALVLMARAARLTDINVVRGQFWRSLPARERPRGETGRRMARSALELTWLQFAKGAAALAIVLCTLAYTSHGPGTSASAEALPLPMKRSD